MALHFCLCLGPHLPGPRNEETKKTLLVLFWVLILFLSFFFLSHLSFFSLSFSVVVFSSRLLFSICPERLCFFVPVAFILSRVLSKGFKGFEG